MIFKWIPKYDKSFDKLRFDQSKYEQLTLRQLEVITI